MFISRLLITLGKGMYARIAKVSFLYFFHTILGTVILFLSAVFTALLLRKKQIAGVSDYRIIALLIGVCLLVQWLLTVPRMKQMEKIGDEIKNNLRITILKKLFLLGPASVTEQRTGELASMVTFRSEWIKRYYTEYIPVALSSIFNVLCILIFLFSVDILCALSAFLAASALVICPHVMSDKMKKEGEQEWQAHDGYVSECLDSVQGITALKGFNADAEQAKKLKNDGEKYRRIIMSHLKITIIEGTIMDFFIRFGCVLPVMISVIKVSNRSLEPSALVYIFYLSLAAFNPLLSLINAWHLGFNGMSAADKIGELLRIPPTFPQYKAHALPDTYNELKNTLDTIPVWNNTPVQPFTGDVVFDNVCFSYDETEVLHTISFTIKNGTMTALVGASGSGKSTIAKLLGGFYFPTKGRVLVGDCVLNEDTVEHIQNHIGAVWQNPHLFFGSVKDNLKVAGDDADDEQLESAAQNVNLAELIHSLPNGYDTSVYEMGARFSGGERQRMAIARCYVRNAPLLLFDEATSSLDRKNEKAVQESFKRLRQGKTTLVIAHRLSTICEADTIVMIENGRIVATGTHEALQKSSVQYQKLMAGQFDKNP